MSNRSCEREPAFHLKRWLDASSVGVTDHVAVIIWRKTLKSAKAGTVGMNWRSSESSLFGIWAHICAPRIVISSFVHLKR